MTEPERVREGAGWPAWEADEGHPYWRALCVNAPDYMALVDAQRRVLWLNRTPPGSTREEVLGHPFDRFVTGADLALASDVLHRVLRTRQPGSYEAQAHFPDGSDAWLHMRVVPVADRRDMVLIVTKDMTGQRHAERARDELEVQLHQRQKLEAIGVVAARMAHEINNPVQAITTYADLLLERLPRGEERRFVGEIAQQADRVAESIRRLLAFVKPQRDRYRSVDLEALVQRALARVSNLMRMDSIAVHTRFEAALPSVWCRRKQIEHVMLDLLTHVRTGLDRELAGRHLDKWIEVVGEAHLRDAGHGVRIALSWPTTAAAGPRPKAGDERPPGGFGDEPDDDAHGWFALAASRSIVEEHGGELSLREPSGGHARLVVELPVDGVRSLAEEADGERTAG